MLLLTYKVVLPGQSTCRKLPGVRGTAATALFRSYRPENLKDAIPLSVIGALSRGLFDDKDSHKLRADVRVEERCHLLFATDRMADLQSQAKY